MAAAARDERVMEEAADAVKNHAYRQGKPGDRLVWSTKDPRCLEWKPANQQLSY